MSYRDTLRKHHDSKRANCINISLSRAIKELSKSEQREELRKAVLNTAALPVCSDGLAHNAGEGDL